MRLASRVGIRHSRVLGRNGVLRQPIRLRSTPHSQGRNLGVGKLTRREDQCPILIIVYILFTDIITHVVIVIAVL